MLNYLKFWLRMVECAVRGSRRYYLWLGALAAIAAYGGYHYYEHLAEGFIVSNMTDQVSWGIGIANFVYFVGVAVAPAVLVAPAYFYRRKDIQEVVTLSLVFALVAIVLCLLFIVTDIGRPERAWHLFPPFGRLNITSSLLAWDVVVFNGYIALNLYLPAYLLWKRYSGKEPTAWAYLPFEFLAVLWAMAVHDVTAFLLSGLGSRHFWNTAILAPRFLISAGASGPALLTVVLLVVRRLTPLAVKDSVFEYLKTVLKITMPVNLFLLACEVFHEFYTGNIHIASARYLYFGLHGHDMLTKFIWLAIGLNLTATVLLLRKGTKALSRAHLIACGLSVFGIWIEKGMGLIFPGFIPTPIGEILEYYPSFGEVWVNLGVVALGTLLFTVAAKVTIAVQTGQLRAPGVPTLRPSAPVLDAPPVEPAPAVPAAAGGV